MRELIWGRRCLGFNHNNLLWKFSDPWKLARFKYLAYCYPNLGNPGRLPKFLIVFAPLFWVTMRLSLTLSDKLTVLPEPSFRRISNIKYSREPNKMKLILLCINNTLYIMQGSFAELTLESSLITDISSSPKDVDWCWRRLD